MGRYRRYGRYRGYSDDVWARAFAKALSSSSVVSFRFLDALRCEREVGLEALKRKVVGLLISYMKSLLSSPELSVEKVVGGLAAVEKVLNAVKASEVVEAIKGVLFVKEVDVSRLSPITRLINCSGKTYQIGLREGGSDLYVCFHE